MRTSAVYDKLEKVFSPHLCTDVFPKIGLQFSHTDEVDAVYTAVFTGPQVFQQLREKQVSRALLFTHHPVPPRDELESKGSLALPPEEILYLKRRQIDLFSYHIPLDRNGPYSPGSSLAKALGSAPYGAFYFQNNVHMGVLCDSPFRTVRELASAVREVVGHPVKRYPYGEDELAGGRFAIMAGGASDPSVIDELKDQGIRAFLTGVTNPAIDWVAPLHTEARRCGVSLIGATHYSTEKWALLSVLSFFESLGLPASFLPEDPFLNEL